MIELVTLEQAKSYAQFTGDENDQKIRLLIRSSSRLILKYLKLDESAYLNSDGRMDVDSETGGYFEVPEEVQSATCYLIALQLRDSDGVEMEKWKAGFLPAPVISMLFSDRVPTIA